RPVARCQKRWRPFTRSARRHTSRLLRAPDRRQIPNPCRCSGGYPAQRSGGRCPVLPRSDRIPALTPENPSRNSGCPRNPFFGIGPMTGIFQTMQPGISPKPAVLAVIPCLNEAAHIEAVACQVLREADRIPLRLVIADGGSTDGTREIVKVLAAKDDRVFFLHNEKRIQSAALNLAVQRFGGGSEFLIRVDAHCRYPERYCENLLEEQAATGADSVVVSLVAEGETCFQ